MWPQSVRATPLERGRALPGDELIAAPIGTLTHAITVRRPAREVWPWLAQMGAVGTLFPAVPGATDGFHVLQLDTGHSLVLGWRPAQNASPIMTWAFVLETVNEAATRLVVRARAARGYAFYGLPPSIGMPFIRLGHFIMQRKQLLGIASRAESRRPPGRTTMRPEAA
jgi:hypothetical protein